MDVFDVMVMKKYIYILFLTVVSEVAVAQQISIPFSCGFETDAETADWVLNQGTDASVDKWKVGSATRSDGLQSLYISYDDGLTPSFAYRPNTVMAYRRIKFPSDTADIQHYDLSFDWKNEGQQNLSELYVYFGPEQNLSSLAVSASSGNVLTSAAVNSMLPLGQGGARALCDRSTWENLSYQINVSKKNIDRFTFALAFIWVNRNTDPNLVQELPLGACIDNIQLCYSRAQRPSNFTAEMDCSNETNSVVLTWKSLLDNFVLEFREADSYRWSVINGLVASDLRDPKDGTKYSYTIEQMKEGLYEFRVRGILGQDTSAYAYCREFRLFCWDNHCINYINFEGENVECRYGTYRNPDSEYGIVDHGEYDQESRHTVCAHKGEYDPRTVDGNGKGLLKVPEDCQASVRLGNWKPGSEEESVTYSLLVDSTDQAILLVRYAVVFEDPGHQSDLNEFHLDILDENDYPIDELCGRAYFLYREEDVGEWNDWNYANHKGKWKDWTTIGLNLSEYHGQVIKVRLSTFDCGQGGHFTYAYYVMDCTSAKLFTETCGDIPLIKVDAPDGFDYTWTNESDSIVSHNKTINVGRGDHQRYTCEVCYKEASDCCFQLSTALSPRYPFAEYSVSHEPSKCKNTVRFQNTSHVIMMYDTLTEHYRDEACESYLWDIRSLKHPGNAPMSVSLPNPAYQCDVNGDQIEVTLTAYLAEESCADIRVDTFNIPSILTADKTEKKEFCEGNAIMFAGEYRTETGTYLNPLKNISGCDSLIYLDLTVFPNSPEQFISDTICSDGVYHLDSLIYNKTGIYEAWLRNTHGCDSIINLDLTVLTKLGVDVDHVPTVCADAEKLTVNFDVFHGAFDSLAVRFIGGKHELRDTMIYDASLAYVDIPYPASVQPDHYTAQVEFYQHQSCGNQIFTLPFDINYRSSIIVQRWNDVLGIQNSTYNGGYEFLSYQWYKDDMPIEGETGPYLYVEGGLEIGAQYSAQVMRNDSVMLYICPVTTVDMSGDENIPTLLFGGQQIPRKCSGVARWISNTGNVMAEQYFTKESGILVPALNSGYYMLSVTDAEQNIVKKVLIK